MLKFDPQTIQDWKNRNIENISIEFIQAGCEGTSIRVHENIVLKDYIELETTPGVQIYIHSDNKKILETAYITHTGSKWIMNSSEIITRCGCGKSFGAKTGDSKIDKIRILKSKLSKNKGSHK